MHLGRVPAILVFALPAFAQYAGPAILSRGDVPTGMAGSQISFRPFIELAGVYYTGLAGVAVNQGGEIGNTAAYGIEFSGGVSGAHTWKHTSIGLDYKGSVRHYTKSTYFDAADQSLLLGIKHQFTRHVSLSLRETGGQFSQAYGLVGLIPTVPFDVSSSNVPTTDFFDNRTIYLSSGADLVYQKSARLSFDFGGDGFLNRRRSSALYGVTGAMARADVQYRMSRRTTMGVAYFYSHYHFTGIFSGTDQHGVMGVFSTQLSRYLEFSAYGGLMRVETKFVQNVPVSPVVTALLGITQGTAVVYNIGWEPNFNARLARAFQHGVVYLSGGHTVTPGNGLFLTSTTSLVSAGYNYTGLRRWSMGLNATYNWSNSIANVTGRYRNVTGSLTVARQITRGLHFIASLDANQYGSGDFAKYNRLVYNARIGLGFAPGDVPLRIW